MRERRNSLLHCGSWKRGVQASGINRILHLHVDVGAWLIRKVMAQFSPTDRIVQRLVKAVVAKITSTMTPTIALVLVVINIGLPKISR